MLAWLVESWQESTFVNSECKNTKKWGIIRTFANILICFVINDQIPREKRSSPSWYSTTGWIPVVWWTACCGAGNQQRRRNLSVCYIRWYFLNKFHYHHSRQNKLAQKRVQRLTHWTHSAEREGFALDPKGRFHKAKRLKERENPDRIHKKSNPCGLLFLAEREVSLAEGEVPCIFPSNTLRTSTVSICPYVVRFLICN